MEHKKEPIMGLKMEPKMSSQPEENAHHLSSDEEKFIKTLSLFFHQAWQLWQKYLADGPGSLQPECFENLKQLASSLSSLHRHPKTNSLLREGLKSHMECLLDLTEKAVYRPEGLCFVTGEVGLIPNRMQHDQYEQSLDWIRNHFLPNFHPNKLKPTD